MRRRPPRRRRSANFPTPRRSTFMPEPLSRYDVRQTYDWNYAQAPAPVDQTISPFPGEWTFCGRPAPGPVGIAAGPLLNGAWCRYYASLGWDVLTYKTVRSRARACYPAPNLAPVACESLAGDETHVDEAERMNGSWAVSFGMPSAEPAAWREDVRGTRAALAPSQLLIVSVVATAEPDWTLDRLAVDYAECARWAIAAGADAVEANLSCPNVASVDGDLYRRPGDAQVVAQRLREAVGAAPLVLKIGHLPEPQVAAKLIAATAPWVDALNMTNSVAAKVRGRGGAWLFDGQRRGICGAACREPSLRQVAAFAEEIDRQGVDLRVIGTGGVFSANDVRRYLDAGAECIQVATAAMVEPEAALRLRNEWKELN